MKENNYTISCHHVGDVTIIVISGDITVCVPLSVKSVIDFDTENKIWEKEFPPKEIEDVLSVREEYIDYKTLIRGRLITVSSLLDNGYKYSIKDIIFLENYLVEEYKQKMMTDSVSLIAKTLDLFPMYGTPAPRSCIKVIADCMEIVCAVKLAGKDVYPILYRVLDI